MLRAMSNRLRSLCAAIVISGIAALASSCGGDGGDTSTSASAGGGETAAQPSQPIAERVGDLERATSTLDCEDALAVVHPVVLPDPHGGQTKDNCAAAVSTVRRIEGFEPIDSQDFGSAALVDAQVGGQKQSLYWVLDDGGDLKWIGVALVGRQIGTHPRQGIDYDTAVDAFVQALRDEDCRAAFAQLAPGSRVSYGSQKAFCSKFDDTFTADSESFGTVLQKDPEAQPVKLGGTIDTAFYGVSTKPDGYRTLILNPVKGQAKVYDVIPGAAGGAR